MNKYILRFIACFLVLTLTLDPATAMGLTMTAQKTPAPNAFVATQAMTLPAAWYTMPFLLPDRIDSSYAHRLPIGLSRSSLAYVDFLDFENIIAIVLGGLILTIIIYMTKLHINERRDTEQDMTSLGMSREDARLMMKLYGVGTIERFFHSHGAGLGAIKNYYGTEVLDVLRKNLFQKAVDYYGIEPFLSVYSTIRTPHAKDNLCNILMVMGYAFSQRFFKAQNAEELMDTKLLIRELEGLRDLIIKNMKQVKEEEKGYIAEDVFNRLLKLKLREQGYTHYYPLNEIEKTIVGLRAVKFRLKSGRARVGPSQSSIAARSIRFSNRQHGMGMLEFIATALASSGTGLLLVNSWPVIAPILAAIPLTQYLWGVFTLILTFRLFFLIRKPFVRVARIKRSGIIDGVPGTIIHHLAQKYSEQTLISIARRLGRSAPALFEYVLPHIDQLTSNDVELAKWVEPLQHLSSHFGSDDWVTAISFLMIKNKITKIEDLATYGESLTILESRYGADVGATLYAYAIPTVTDSIHEPKDLLNVELLRQGLKNSLSTLKEGKPEWSGQIIRHDSPEYRRDIYALERALSNVNVSDGRVSPPRGFSLAETLVATTTVLLSGAALSHFWPAPAAVWPWLATIPGWGWAGLGVVAAGLLWFFIRPNQKIKQLDALDEPQVVESLKGMIGAFGSQTDKEFKRSLEKAKLLVNMLEGPGLNEADKQLMTLFFQDSNPQVKQRLLTAREFMFERGRVLAERGIAETGVIARKTGEGRNAAEAALRIRSILEIWRHWALDYAAAYLRDHPTADEDNVKIVGKSVADEINQDIYQPLFIAAKEIERLTQRGQIDPYGVKLKLRRMAPDAKVSIKDRPARVGFLPMKGDPWQVGHIFVMLEAIAMGRLDKLVIMVDNSDPERKPNLSSLTIREPITLELLKILEPFVEYTPISKEESDLRTADGERSIFRLMQFNRTVPTSWFYMVGSDHRHWEIMRSGKAAPDTAKKLHDHRLNKTDDYAGEKLGIIFVERKGEEFQEGEMDLLRAQSGIDGITKIHQPMDTSSTRVRKDKHWWTVPYDVFAMAEAFKFWGADKASQVDLRNSPSQRTGKDSRLLGAAS